MEAAQQASQVSLCAVPLLRDGNVESVVHSSSGFFLHSRHDMGIEVEGYANFGMAQSLASDLRVDPSAEKMSCMGVSQVMKSNARKPLHVGNTPPLMCNRTRL